MVRKIYLLLPLILFFMTGFIIEDDIPADLEKVDMRLDINEIAITFFALPSGEATLIQHAVAGNIMVNTGGPETQSKLKHLLDMYNIENLRAIILTKDHPQYNGNLDWLSKNYHVNEVIIGNRSINNIGKWKNQKHTLWKQNGRYEIVPNLMITVLNEKDGMDLSLKYGNHHILYMSTTDKNIEHELVKQDLADVNILKVADFASDAGTSKIFLNHIDPQTAIIFKKKGIFPSQAVIERLHDAWIDIYQTNQYGNISIKFNYDHYEVITIPVNNAPNK